MRRDRVAVLGVGGLFEESVIEALGTHRLFLVRRFPVADPETTLEMINEFRPHAVLVVRSGDESLAQGVISHMEADVPIVTLDPKEPAITLSFKANKAGASLEGVLEALRAARALSSATGRPAQASRGKRNGERGAA
ncbi:MAG: hypothetical protein HY681_07670 [Chloroflexi bacterium]|nr:hypothetical protein [Chloroflexota bacterium]